MVSSSSTYHHMTAYVIPLSASIIEYDDSHATGNSWK